MSLFYEPGTKATPSDPTETSETVDSQTETSASGWSLQISALSDSVPKPDSSVNNNSLQEPSPTETSSETVNSQTGSASTTQSQAVNADSTFPYNLSGNCVLIKLG